MSKENLVNGIFPRVALEHWTMLRFRVVSFSIEAFLSILLKSYWDLGSHTGRQTGSA